MPGYRVSGSLRLAIASALALLASLSSPLQAQDPRNAQAPTAAEGSTPFNLQVKSNLVVVRVLVRDAQGKPVDGLRKEDFRVLDSGKEQSIAQFESRSPGSETSAATQPATHFIALFFDDLDTPLGYLTYARDAADQFLKAYLRPSDRVALITSSGTNVVDLTSDVNRLHDALFKIAPNEHGGDPRLQSRRSLDMLDHLVMRLSQAPGQRSIIFASPGFMSANEQAHVDGIIDRALRSQVVISTLNPKGFETAPVEGPPETSPPTAVPPQETNARPGSRTLPAQAGPSGEVVDSLDPDVILPPQAVLKEVAMATGGVYFHDNNDLKTGFYQLSGTAEPYYILAFHPTDLKQNGRFHPLKINLTEAHAGYHLQARSGYFAPKEGAAAEGPTQLETPSPVVAATDEDAQEKERIRRATISKTDQQELPVELRTEVSKGAESGELAVLAHLDTKALRFHKEGGRNQITVTFVSVIFDGSGKYVAGQQRQAKVDLLDDALPGLLAAGMDVKVTFPLKPGTYTLREVVTDSEEHHMTASSHNISVQ
jgi:VWFA-related protein